MIIIRPERSFPEFYSFYTKLVFILEKRKLLHFFVCFICQRLSNKNNFVCFCPFPLIFPASVSDFLGIFAPKKQNVIMEEMKDVDLNFYKVRSYSSCLTKGFKLFADNLWTILKNTWTSVLLFALCIAVCSFLYQPLARLVFTFADPSKLPYFSQILFGGLVLFLLLVASVVSVLFGGQLTVLVRNFVQTGHLEYSGKGKIMKAAMEPSGKLLAFDFMFLIAVAVLSGVFHYFVGMAWWSWFWDLLLVLALFIPYGAFVASHLLDPNACRCSVSAIKDLYRNWGAWSAVFLVSGFSCALCAVFFCMPSFVLLFARSEAFFMELGGDLTDLPAAFNLMQFLIVFLSSALSLFFFSSMFFSMLFMYGSLEKKKEEITLYEQEQQRLQQA